MNNIVIGEIEIGPNQKPFLIAEMSGNHNQNLDRALEIVEAAANAGANALKIQTYTPDIMTLNLDRDEFLIRDSKSLWKGTTLYELYSKAYTPWEWHAPIFERTKKLGMVPLSTPFDASSVDFLEQLGTPIYKIASFENTDLALIERVARTGKPLIISTGMATLAELDESVKAARKAGCGDLILLKCTSSYPASAEHTNLKTIASMREIFDCQVGLSDHTMGVGVAVAAVSFGATVIEKHFTLNRSEGGVDSQFSLEPHEFRTLVEETERAWQSIGKIQYGPTPSEVASLLFRRSIYITQDMKQGDTFSNENIRAVRPGKGLAPKHLKTFLGRTISKSAKIGEPLDWTHL